MNVTVDKDFARFGSKSYAINKINTVEVRERNPYGKTGMWICGIIALFCILSVLGSISDPAEGTATTLGMGVIFAGLAYWMWTRSKIVEYQLFLMTSSSETQAFISRDGDAVTTLRDKIESAMVSA